ncbi:TonB-dependent receptor [Sphingomonas cannabina]|uniref:TonB-dependent siderophore receptor n=1 Tax=Sphingomonas cannabina TaxID=2899123 RepID=UPI001F1C40BF|nr:TonB-dependent receptor [Sphingomonas cannabina]UIJ46363.1 TonB-dependent receptor [Sphingomonas cannabina]
MRCSICCLSLLAAPAAHAQIAISPPAQPQNRDVVRAADDAFGRRIGVEEVGLYTESEVRGFDLQSAGNYRIEDHYFVRAAGMLQPLTEGTAIRVGANGLRTDFAAPSGVVQYDLPDGVPGMQATIEAGWWGGSGPIVLTRFAGGTQDSRLSIAGGLQLSVGQRYTDGTGGDFIAVGLVPRWTPAAGIRLAGVWGHNWYTRGADTTFASAGTPPARISLGIDRTQSWMDASNESDLSGAILDIDAGDGWSLGASAFRSELAYRRNVFNLIRLSDAGTGAEVSGLLFGEENRRSFSAEITAAKRFTTGALDHRLIAAIRRRDSVVLSDPGAAFTLGHYPDIDRPPALPRPPVSLNPLRLRDEVEQWTGGLGYRLSIGSFAELRADVQRVEYRKQARALDGSSEHQTSRPWLYGGALSVGFTRALTGFASYARGLEEAGVAPANAVNRGAVLPAAISRQAELGMKYAIAGGPTLIAGVFDLSKPLPGIDAGGAFDFVGRVRHRGAELSLAGPITPRLGAVLGATYLDARTEGELVDRGLVGARPIGRPEVMALANLTWRVPGVAGLTLDGGVSIRGERYADRENRVTLPGYAIVNLGLRQRFAIGDHSVTLRARVANLTNRFAWNVSNSGLLTQNIPRVLTLTLTGEI